MQDDAVKESPTTRSALYIRLSPVEYRRIAADAAILGKTLPKAVKDRYFTGEAVSPLVSAEDQRSLMATLSRIGNNINQIAKQLNSGMRVSFKDELVGVQEQLSMLRTYFTSTYGPST